jgi:hypothetical protein
MESRIHYYVHNSPLILPVLNQMDPVHAFKTFSLMLVLILSSFLCLGLQICLLTAGFSIEILYVFSFMHHTATCPDSFILLDLIT